MARRAGRTALVSFVFAACVVSWAPEAQAASPGSLDPTFGSGGTLSLTDPGGLSGGGAVALPDGSIIVGANKGLSSPTVVTLIKIDPNGHVDPSFHEDGFASAPPVSYPSLRSLTLAPDGKIVGVGIAATNGGGQAWLVTRFDSDGSLDQTFGNEGVVVMPMPG